MDDYELSRIDRITRSIESSLDGDGRIPVDTVHLYTAFATVRSETLSSLEDNINEARSWTSANLIDLYGCGCCCGRVGDANGVGGDIPTIGDISTIIDNLFISGTTLICLQESDANQSGGVDPTNADITIGDVATIIDNLFITGTPLAECM